MTKISPAVRQWLIDNDWADENDDEGGLREVLNDAFKSGELTPEKMLEIEQKQADKQAEEFAIKMEGMGFKRSSPSPEEVFGGAKTGGQPSVKGPDEMYSTVRYKGNHAKTGRPVKGFDGCEVELPSQYDKARVGVWAKMLCSRSKDSPVILNDHDKALIGHIFENEKFVGEMDGKYRDDVPGKVVKDLLGDSGGASGGAYLSPYFFDAAIVTYPLLNGEIFPFVDIRDVPARQPDSGRRRWQSHGNLGQQRCGRHGDVAVRHVRLGRPAQHDHLSGCVHYHRRPRLDR